ncbi:MAG: alpha/beta fold hydrolase [candidate division NC10 bacterium]|nr:alpha/beta fold hydrolase [candidate division NC10 bacterium]
MMLIFRILLYALIVLVLFNVLLVYINTHLPRYPYDTPPFTFGWNYEEISIKTVDGLSLSGWFIPGSRGGPVVILAHGLGAGKSDLVDFAPFLYKGGYNVLLFDFRAHGKSDGSSTSFGYHEQKDLSAAIDFLKARKDVDPQRIGVLGLSLGGAVAILAAAQLKEIRAVAVEGVYASFPETVTRHLYLAYRLPKFPFTHLALWTFSLLFKVDIDRISPIESIGRISPRPLFIIAGGKDERMTPEEAWRLYQAAGEPKELWVVPGAGHLEARAVAGPEYERRVLYFFNKHL